MIRLVLERPGMLPVLMAFNQPVVVVGRGGDDPAAAPKVDWVLPFQDVSRRQCRFSQVGERTYVEGLSTKNPVRVNRGEIRELTRLQAGDRVEFGYCAIRLAGDEVRGEAAASGRAEAEGRAAEAGAARQADPEDMSAIVRKARRWAALGQAPGLLLAGAELRRGLLWLRGGAELGAAGGLVRRFVEASARTRSARVQRATLAGVAVALALAGGSLTARGLVGAWTPEAVARTGLPRAEGCRRAVLGRAEEAVAAARREGDPSAGSLLAGYALQLASRGGCEAESGAEAAVREQLAARRGWVLGTHAAPVRAAALRGDGRVAATGDAHGRVLLWNGPGSAPVELAGATGAIARLVFSGDGRRLAAGGAAGEVLVWDVSQFPLVEGPERLPGRLDAIGGLAFDAGGGLLAAGDRRGALVIWDMSEGASFAVAAQSAAPGAVSDLAFGTDRMFGLAGGRALAWTVRAPGGGPRLGAGEVLPTEGTVTSLAVEARGLVVTGEGSGAVTVWRRQRGRLVGQPVARHRAAVIAVRAVPRRAATLSVARDGSVLLADLAAPVRRDGTPLVYAFAGARGPVSDLVVETSGRRALTIGEELAVWDLVERRVEPMAREGASTATISAAAGAGAWALIGGEDGGVRAWDLRADRGSAGAYALTDHGTDVVSLALARRGTALASAGRDERVRVWRLDGDGVPSPQGVLAPARAIERVALSEGGRWLAGSAGPFVFVWDLEQPRREPAELVGHAAAIRELTFAGDGWLVSADLAGEIHSWRVAAGGPESHSRRTTLPSSVWALATSAEHVAVGTGSSDDSSGSAYAWPLGEAWSEEARVAEHSRPVTALVFSADGGRLASGAADGGVRSAVLTDGQWRALAPYDHGESVRALAFAGDGTLAIGGLGGAVALIDPRAGGERRRFAAHAATVTGLAFGTSASRLVTASQSGELKLWRLDEGERALALVGHSGPIFEVQSDRAGRVIATAADDSSVRVWPLEATGLLRMACLAAGRDLTADEWSGALPGHRREALCAGADGPW